MNTTFTSPNITLGGKTEALLRPSKKPSKISNWVGQVKVLSSVRSTCGYTAL